MSSFIPNSFQVPNIIVDEIMEKVSPNALKCYLIIIRKTKGWDKEWDKISTTQIMQFSGIKKKYTVYRAIQELVDINIIEANKISGKLTSYRVVSNLGTSTNNGNEPVPINGTTTSTDNGYPTKTTITKTTITNKENIKENIPIVLSSLKNTKKDFLLFLDKLQKNCIIKTKITKGRGSDGYESYIKIQDKKKLHDDYIQHQISEKKFAKTITNFMLDYDAFKKGMFREKTNSEKRGFKLPSEYIEEQLAKQQEEQSYYIEGEIL